MPSNKKWEDKQGISGVKVTINDNLNTVLEGVTSAVGARMSTKYECQAVTREMLACSISFIETFCTFISDTYNH